jgi:alpha-1,3-rhamnosyl/mannosyltransferase
VPSEFVRREIREVFDVPDEKIVVTLEAARANFFPRSPEQRFCTLRRHGLTDRSFLLCVGTLEPRKNLEAAIRAHGQLPPSIRSRVPLVIVGMRGWLTSPLERTLSGPVAKREVIPLGFVDDDALADLYSAAVCLLYPSIYEGFGLPVVEAMSCGLPVIVSNRSSLPEVGGDAAIVVEPEDQATMAAAALALIEDGGDWGERSRASTARARDFSWQRCASETLKAYIAAVSA